MPIQAKQTLIYLTPKSLGSNNLRKFRPIGLCKTLYKLVTKIIVNRIKPILPHLINLIQASFMANRRASNNAIIVQEFISHFRKMKGKKVGMILKKHLIDLNGPLSGIPFIITIFLIAWSNS